MEWDFGNQYINSGVRNEIQGLSWLQEPVEYLMLLICMQCYGAVLYC